MCVFLVSTIPPSIHLGEAQRDDFWIPRAPLTENWNPLTNSPELAVVNGKIYAIGELTNDEYDPTTNMWTQKSPMPTKRSDFAVAVYKNKIYIIGGKKSNGLTGANEAYNPRTDSWETKKEMPTPRCYLEANMVENKIYLIAGYNTTYDSIPDFNEVYSPETDTWTTKAPMPIPKYAYASTVLDNKIYFFAGAPGESNINQIYNPETDSWSEGMRLPTFCRSISAVATSGTWAPKRIYVIGGSEGFAYAVNLNRIYDPQTDEWSSGAPMKTSRYSLSVAVVKDFLYAIGGWDGLVPVMANEQYVPAGHTLADTVVYFPPTPTPSPIPNPTTIPNSTPTPTVEPTLSPTYSPDPSDPEFPVFIVASIAIGVIVGIGIILYFKKRKT